MAAFYSAIWTLFTAVRLLAWWATPLGWVRLAGQVPGRLVLFRQGFAGTAVAELIYGMTWARSLPWPVRNSLANFKLTGHYRLKFSCQPSLDPLECLFDSLNGRSVTLRSLAPTHGLCAGR
jgi:hypothetical protein